MPSPNILYIDVHHCQNWKTLASYVTCKVRIVCCSACCVGCSKVWEVKNKIVKNASSAILRLELWFFSQGIARVPMCWFSSTIHGCFLAFWRLYRIYCCTITGPRTEKCVRTSFYNVGWFAYYCWVELCDRLAVCVCLRSCSLVIIWPNCLTWKL